MTTARIEAITREGGRIISFDEFIRIPLRREQPAVDEYSVGEC